MTFGQNRTNMRVNFTSALQMLLFVAVAMILAPVGSRAQTGERITDYQVHIAVNRDRTVDVTETIKVNVRGQTIKRGLLRDIPVFYENRDGSALDIELDVTGVARDGRREPYERSYDGRYVRLRIGDADVFLQHGLHTYEINYTIQNSIGFFDDIDEIYWNAIGTEWPFWIDKAKVTVQLPQGADIKKYAVYTGYANSKGNSYEVTNKKSNQITVRSTKAFSPSQGMTVAVGWQKDIVLAPTEAELLEAELLKESPFYMLILGAVLQIGWLYFAWLRVGKDPDGGAIIPRFRAPKDLSPAVSSYISGLGSFEKSQQASFMAALINLAIKGFVTLDNSTTKMLVRRQRSPQDHAVDDLPAGEKALFKKMMGNRKTARFADMEYSTMSGIMSAFSSALHEETDKVYFHRNTGYVIPGLLLATLGIIGYFVATVILVPPYFPPIFEVFCAVILVALFFIGQAIWRFFVGKGSLSFGKVMSIPFFGIMFAGPILFVELEGDITGFGELLNLPAVGLIVIMVLGLFFFFDWMKAPTKLGREVLDEVEGLKLFMTVTVAEQANAASEFDMPELTPKLYEDLLPYAIALGIEKKWSATFEEKVFSQLPPDQSYHPVWYRGDTMDMTPAQSLAGMTQSMGTDLSSAMTPPASSSSGSGGGGSSGGGGGGGGGGGW